MTSHQVNLTWCDCCLPKTLLQFIGDLVMSNTELISEYLSKLGEALGHDPYPAIMELVRKNICDYVIAQSGGIIQSGPFKDIKFITVSKWGGNDIAAKLIGSYENHIQSFIESIALNISTPLTFLDIGAAEGYFAIPLAKKFGAHVIAFEEDQSSRDLLRENAKLNGVESHIKIFGSATTENLLETLDRCEPQIALCDIEGGEFEVFTKDVFSSSRHTSWIIEIHDFMRQEPEKDLHNLIAAAIDTHNVTALEPADLSEVLKLPMVSALPDNYRLLALSEGRPRLMEWLLFTPKKDIIT